MPFGTVDICDRTDGRFDLTSHGVGGLRRVCRLRMECCFNEQTSFLCTAELGRIVDSKGVG